MKDSETEFNETLPEGIETEDNYLMKLEDAESGKEVGLIWFQYDLDDDDAKFVFLNDFLVSEAERRNGYATAAVNERTVLPRPTAVIAVSSTYWITTPAEKLCMKKAGIRLPNEKKAGPIW